MRNPDWSREELILALDVYVRFGKKQLDASHPAIIELSRILRSAPIHSGKPRGENFRNPNGVSMKLGNFLRVDPSHNGKGLSRGNRAEELIWAEFAHLPYRLHREARRLRRAWREYISEPSPPEDQGGDGELEGELRLYQHYARERKRALVERKKAQALERTGKLTCEACGFDFAEFYGDRGYGFAECHHVLPLGDLIEARRTKLSDLAIVCSNCHRMIHKSPMLSIGEIRDLVQRSKLEHATLAGLRE